MVLRSHRQCVAFESRFPAVTVTVLVVRVRAKRAVKLGVASRRAVCVTKVDADATALRPPRLTVTLMVTRPPIGTLDGGVQVGVALVRLDNVPDEAVHA